MRVHNETGEEVTLRQIKVALPNLSFGPEADLTEFGYPTLIEVDPPVAEAGMRVVRGPNEKVKAHNPDGTWIAGDPDTPQNEAWLWQQTWVQEPIPAPPVPDVIDAAQGQYILIEMADAEGVSYWDKVLAYIAAIPSKKKREQAEVAVLRTGRWRRDSATLIQMATALGITEQQMDDMFIAANKVVF